MTHTTRYGRQTPTSLLLVALAALTACAQTPLEPAGEGAARDEPPLLPNSPALSATPAPAPEPVSLRADHPHTYVVVPGDTLWTIADRFLDTPWRWREVWRQNPAIQNPNLLYPGDVIELYFEAGQPRLQLAAGHPTVKLSPQVRIQAVAQPIPTVPRDAIEPFMKKSLVVSRGEWTHAPYILGSIDSRAAFTTSDRIYARGTEFDQPRYRVFRVGQEYRDPASHESLGFDLMYVGEARLEEDGDPAPLTLTATSREARVGDRLFEIEEEPLIYQFVPHPPPPDTEGRILAVMGDGSALIGPYHTVVLNVGEQDGIEPGHVLAIRRIGRDAVDPLRNGEKVHLPDEKAGLLMVYKVYERVSYGLVMGADRPVRIMDRVASP